MLEGNIRESQHEGTVAPRIVAISLIAVSRVPAVENHKTGGRVRLKGGYRAFRRGIDSYRWV